MMRGLPATPPRAEVRETHTAYVLMIGDVVFKAKKSLRTPFLDYSTPELRAAACHSEVDLNRRLCPDVYLGVAEVSDPCGGPAEPLVKMRRMPDTRRLATLVETGQDVTDQLDAVAGTLARFHRSCRRGPDVARDASRDAVTARWRDNLDEMSGYGPDLVPGAAIDEIRRRAFAYLAGRGALFDERIADGRIVDGHGDLLADDIFCLPDGPRILDCLDFDDRLRHLDVVDDIACLAMDLEYLGRADLGEMLLDRVWEHVDDDPPASLVHHFVAYRAFVRAKVAALRHTQGVESARADVRRHCGIALRHLRSGTVRLGIIGGLPGTGKSTLSRAVADRTGAVVLASDRMRRRLAGIDPDRPSPAPFECGLYTREMTDRTYDALLSEATQLTRLGQSVVIDASWTDHRHVDRAIAAARHTHSALVEVECAASRAVAVRRIEHRSAPESDATAEVYDAMAARPARWSTAAQVDTAADLHTVTEAALALWNAASVPGSDCSVPPPHRRTESLPCPPP